MRALLLVITVSIHVNTAEWIDPHSMDTLPETNQLSRIKPIESASDVHLKRIVRVILNNAYLNTDFGHHEGYINLKLTPSEYQLLTDFSQSTESNDKIISEVSSIFENAFQKPAGERYQELILTLEEKIYNLIFNPTSMSLVAAVFCSWLTYKLLKAHFTWGSIFYFFLVLGYIIDFVVTYLNILREEEVDSMVKIKQLGTVPPECDPQKMSWWAFMKTQFASNFGENPCKAYYHATYQNYMYVVAPSKILIRQFRTLLVEPCGDIGEAFGKFGRGMFTNLPWGLNVIIFPVMLVTACALVFIFFLFITKPHFKISVFHLFTIELGKNEALPAPRNNENPLRIQYRPNRNKNRKNVKEVGDSSNHRALVQEVSHDNCSSRDKKEKTKEKKEQGGGDFKFQAVTV